MMMTIKRSCTIIAMLALGMSTGACTTVVSRTPKYEVTETEMLPGSSRHVLREPAVTRRSEGVKEVFLLQGKLFHEWKVQRVERRIQRVERLEHYALAGQPEYNMLEDIIGEPIVLMIIPVAILSPKANWPLIGRTLFSAPLPGVMALSTPRKTVNVEKLPDVVLPPLRKSELVNREVRVQLLDERRRTLMEKELPIGSEMAFGLCSYMMERGTDATLIARIADDHVVVEGAREYRFTFPLDEMVARQLASEPDPRQYPAANLVWVGKLKIVEEGNGDGILEGGEIVGVQGRIRNKGPGPALGLDGYVRSTDSEPVNYQTPICTLLRPGADSEVNISVILPFARQDGVLRLSMVARDRLGRESENRALDIPYAKTAELPELQVAGAKLMRKGGSNYLLRVQIRNKGRRIADDVEVRLTDPPRFVRVAMDTVKIKRIDAYSIALADYELQIGESETGDVGVTITATERMNVGGTEREMILSLVLAEPAPKP